MNINDKEVLNLKVGTLIDCREVDEFNNGYIPNAINAPLAGLILNANSFLTNKEDTYYIYCLGGGRANHACASLKEQGYNVKSIGGISEYRGELKKP